MGAFLFARCTNVNVPDNLTIAREQVAVYINAFYFYGTYSCFSVLVYCIKATYRRYRSAEC